ncbi:hypothetical protein EDI_061530 [Entamoeba dispar SAW760]|uniref:Uncharacterized protein n=1 Tax=Entamoeba dispar (strain ATCC PRA-260 / SAW760) TaxID=370354 RepID=B0E6P4_ENTDS|nr:uncharacterized protein EDI_061530 [Entamoeba dispar SAW760]EDR29798.1 hypothetical protein EDI_061530 [Entamoeba dispar SAW760]|eukprot:EDR29798.1 hypothetical protein EDI_061530 [Entamoeba dispar SAW760]
MDTPIQIQKRKEGYKRVLLCSVKVMILSIILNGLILILYNSITKKSITSIIIISITNGINVLILHWKCTENKVFDDEPGLYFITKRGLNCLITIIISSIILGIISFYEYGILAQYYIESTLIDESITLMIHCGIYFGLSSSVFYLFLDRLYIPYYSVLPKTKSNWIQQTLRQTVITFICNLFIFVFIIFTVKMYYLMMYGFQPIVSRFNFSNIFTLIPIILIYSMFSRLSFNYLSKIMSIELPLEDKFN